MWNHGIPCASALGISFADSLSHERGECSADVLVRGARNAGPRSGARCVPWFLERGASGEASSVLDPGGRGAMGLS